MHDPRARLARAAVALIVSVSVIAPSAAVADQPVPIEIVGPTIITTAPAVFMNLNNQVTGGDALSAGQVSG
jgi:hypothetical protein